MSPEYIALGYKPTTRDLVCEYYVEPKPGISLEEASAEVAGESSIDTWTHIYNLKPAVARKFRPHVFEVNKRKHIVKIAYRDELFELNNVPGILSAIAGNIFGMKAIKNLRLEDVNLPTSIIKSFKGPAFGVPGIRRYLKVFDRPLTGTIVKPKVGLTPKEHAKYAYEAWVGGLDLVKDDENLTNQTFNRFEDRVIATLDAMDRAAEETGERKLAVLNTTAEAKEMLRRAQFIYDHGGNVAMIDIIAAGWSALQTLREANLGLIIHAHRAGHAAFTRNPKHGISMFTVAKFARLVGVDTLHIGTTVGKMVGPREEVVAIEKIIERKVVFEKERIHTLSEKWYHIKPVFAVASGGMHPGLVPAVVKALGKDVIIQAGGGCSGHRWGVRAGAIAMRQAVDAVIEGVDLREYAKSHKELEQALVQWGYMRLR